MKRKSGIVFSTVALLLPRQSHTAQADITYTSDQASLTIFNSVPANFARSIADPAAIRILGISGDGSTAVGYISQQPVYGDDPVSWGRLDSLDDTNTEPIEIQNGHIIALDTPMDNGYSNGVAFATNYNGSEIVGAQKIGSFTGLYTGVAVMTTQAVSWDSSGMQVVNSAPGSYAMSISSNGQFIGGGLASEYYDPAAGGNAMTSSAFVSGAPAPSGAYYVSGLSNGGIASAIYYQPQSMPINWDLQNAITPDGTKMAGRYYFNGPASNYGVGALWQNGSITEIGPQTDYADATEFSAMSADGSVLVGTTQMGPDYSDAGTAVIYTSSLGLMNLGDYMTDVLGLPATTGCGGVGPTEECWVPTGISANGDVIVGYIDSEDSGPSDDQSFMLTIDPLPEPSAFCVALTGALPLMMRRKRTPVTA
jgi:hypothetical protein